MPDAARESLGGGVAGVGHGDHEVRIDRRLAGEDLSHPAAHGLERAALELRVGPREVDVLEHAQGGAVGLHRDAGLDAALAERHQLTGLHLAQELRADDVERAALRCDDVALAQLPQAQRPHTCRVAERDDAVLGHHDRGVGALHVLHDVGDRVLYVVGRVRGDQRGDDLGVRSRPEPHSLGGQLVVELDGVDQVAVVAQRHDPAVVPVDRLRVLPAAVAGRGVAHVSDRHLARERLQAPLVEHLGDEAHVALGGDVTALRGRDAGRFLAAVLERVEREVGEPGDVLLRCVDAEHAALVARAVTIRGFGRWRRALERRQPRPGVAACSRNPAN